MTGKALVVYVSVSEGNTAKIARALAAPLGAEVLEPELVDPGTLADCTVVGFGSGIFMMSHHPRLRRFVEQLPRVDGTRAFVFSTSGAGRTQKLPWEQSLESMLQQKGYDVVGSFDCRGYDTWLPLRLLGGLNKGHPDVYDLSHAHEFAKRLAPVGARR